MFVRTVKLAGLAALLCVFSGSTNARAAQPPDDNSAPQPAPAKATSGANDAATKAAILASPQWRRVMFEFKEWLSAQQIYDAKQVEQLKARFNKRVAGMSAVELEYLLADMQSKFQILNSSQAQEARAWMASYLSVMSNQKRAEVLKQLPNVATMTAAQLQQEIVKIEQKRASIDQEQSTFQRGQQELATAQIQRDKAAQQTYIRERDRFPTTTYSPYRSSSDANARLNQGSVGSGGPMYTVGPLGGVSMSFSAANF